MGVLEMILLIAGAALAIFSFVIPTAQAEMPKETKKLAQEEIKALVSQEMESIRQHVDDVVDEAVGYAVEKTERSLERLTNEKIMAVNEYSDTVLAEIHRNHEEAMFLYDMLNDKHKNLKNTVFEVNRTVQEVTETKREAEAVVNTFQQLKPDVAEPGTKNPKIQNKKTANHTTENTKTENTKIENKKTENPNTVNKRIDNPKTENRKAVNKKSADPTVSVTNLVTEEQGSVAANNNEKILQMYQQGKSEMSIAKELGLGVGEVKLVIDLYKNML